VPAFDGLADAAFELAAVDQSGERIVGCLIGHLAADAALFGDVAQQQHGAGDVQFRRSDRGGRNFNGAFGAAAM
jgi:hypothetical protein